MLLKNSIKINERGNKYIITHIPELGIDSEKRQALKAVKSFSSSGYDLFGNDIQNVADILFKDYKASLPSRQRYTDSLIEILAQDNLIAITCFESDYKCCHRHVLSASLNGIDVVHL